MGARLYMSSTIKLVNYTQSYKIENFKFFLMASRIKKEPDWMVDPSSFLHTYSYIYPNLCPWMFFSLNALSLSSFFCFLQCFLYYSNILNAFLPECYLLEWPSPWIIIFWHYKYKCFLINLLIWYCCLALLY